MAITHTIDPTRRIVTLHYAGDPDLEQWCAGVEAAFADPAFQPGMNFLADRRAIPHPPDREYLRGIMKFVNRQGARVEGTRWAVLIATPESYGMVPVGHTVMEGDSIEVGVFIDEAAAHKWLAREIP